MQVKPNACVRRILTPHPFPMPSLLQRLFLAVTLLGLLPAPGQVVDTFTEFTIPVRHSLKPGITRITGGLTQVGQEDIYSFVGSATGTITARIRYTHQTANLLIGRPEYAHLSADLGQGILFGPSIVPAGTDAQLGSPFYIQDSTNSISGAAPVVIDAAPLDETSVNVLTVRAPSGKMNPSYTIELEYAPERDAWDSNGESNDTALTALTRDPVAGNLSGTLHGQGDEDWFRFTVPAGRTLRVRVEAIVGGGYGTVPLERTVRSTLLNALAAPLQTAEAGTATFSETAGSSARTFLLRLHAVDAYAQSWRILYILDDALEPNNSDTRAHNLGTLLPGTRIQRPALTVTTGDDDYYYFENGLPTGTPVIIAALRESDTLFGPSVQLIGGPLTAESFADYLVVTSQQLRNISFRVSDPGSSYRLLIKQGTAYDVWQRAAAGAEYNPQPYIPASSDIDRDGLPAALEWALRRAPLLAETMPSITAPYLDGGQWHINLVMPQGGTAAPILVRESTSLMTWTALPPERTNTGGSIIPAGRTAGAVFQISRPGAAKNFLRFEVED